jgi:hypothetical protein
LGAAFASGELIPDSNCELYFDSTNFSACFVHGVDRERNKSFVITVEVDLTARDWRIEQRPGNPTTLIVTTKSPLPVKILELHVRSGTRDEGFAVLRFENREDMLHELN